MEDRKGFVTMTDVVDASLSGREKAHGLLDGDWSKL